MVPVSYNVRSLFVRKTTTLLTAFGIGLVVFVLAAALMLSRGIERTLVTSGRPDAALVLRKGADTELASTIESRQVGMVLSAPGVKKDETGAPLGDGEIVIVIALEKVGTEGAVSNVQVRGTTERLIKARSDVTLLAGRAPQPGADEVMVGKGASGRFRGTELGQKFDLKKNRPVTVVGVFESGGSSFESEIWANIDTARTSFGRDGLVSSISVRLESESKLDAFKAAMESDKQLGLEAFREDDYYKRQSEGTSTFMGAIGVLISFFFSLGAMVGATITMHAAVSQRQREIGTLRALGFSRFAILASFLFEAILLALSGGLVGMGAAILLSFAEISMMNFTTWQEVTFHFEASPGILLWALGAGAAMGLFGGFFPALRAARISPVEAMRA